MQKCSIKAIKIQNYSKWIIDHDPLRFVPDTEDWINIQKSVNLFFIST